MSEGGWKGAAVGATAGGTIGSMFAGMKGALVGGLVGAMAGGAGISPRQLQFGTQGITGGVGQQVIKAKDMISGQQNPFPFQGTERLGQIPVVGDIAKRFQSTGQDQIESVESNKFYEKRDQYAQFSKSFADIQKNDPMHAGDYLTTHKTDFLMAGLSQSINERIGQLDNMRKQVRNQMSQPGATPKDVTEGYAQLEQLYNAKLMMMRSFTAAADRYQKATAASPSKTEGWNR